MNFIGEIATIQLTKILENMMCDGFRINQQTIHIEQKSSICFFDFFHTFHVKQFSGVPGGNRTPIVSLGRYRSIR